MCIDGIHSDIIFKLSPGDGNVTPDTDNQHRCLSLSNKALKGDQLGHSSKCRTPLIRVLQALLDSSLFPEAQCEPDSLILTFCFLTVIMSVLLIAAPSSEQSFTVEGYPVFLLLIIIGGGG